ncbi:unnamed protein product [Pseudo-nitzschia multistriata]|uniref:alpha-1,3-mannosyl-glycoprotein 2-beta-N-acetylglucosaminyltransferase n=1 Tax=Pseudo-nitzschia multistriata TaxID=183589 RepID=A0A448Z4X8_9STRA|nr:unnamed protein product [Pseudo-nitzschia multistriata]
MAVSNRKPRDGAAGSRARTKISSKRGTTPPRLRRRRIRRNVCRRFKAVAATVMSVLLLLWIAFFWGVSSGYFGSWIRMPMGSGKDFPLSPHISNPKPIPSGVNDHDSFAMNTNAYQSPLLIITCKRPNYLNRTLEHVLATIPQPCGFGCPVVVSEDGDRKENEELLFSFRERFKAKGIPLLHIHHKEKKNLRQANSYVKLARHFGWAISSVFDGTALSSDALPERIMILEEDIEVAPDFFSYMESTSTLLDTDPTLLAVSAFNDNGHLKYGDPKRLLRSDFFPGLGWMMTRNLWTEELQSKWPYKNGYWDDWLRETEQRKNRQIIRPEVSRTYHFGSKGGASQNEFGNILERVKINKDPIRWERENLSYLESSAFEAEYERLVSSSKLVKTVKDAKEVVEDLNARIEYEDFSDFQLLAKELGIMDDEKAAVPRTAYRGIVEVRVGTNLLFLTQKGEFNGYKPVLLRGKYKPKN